MTKIAVALTIAGSDSGGGAGIQADLRAFAFNGVHGTSAITCITAQNTLGVTRVDPVPVSGVIAQIEAVVTDIRVSALKTGMLLNNEIIKAVAEQISLHGLSNLVVDPVMVSRTGAQLIDDQAIDSLREYLIPRATILTPNRYEAQLLSGLEIDTLEQMKTAAEKIYNLGAKAVIVKGGGMKGSLQGVDVWFDGNKHEIVHTETIETPHTHGTGCTLSAAIAANLALGEEPFSAFVEAKNYVTSALKNSFALGSGTGPVGIYAGRFKIG